MFNSPILVVGNCVIDDIHDLDTYPAEDNEVRSVQYQRALGGNACNTARILAQLEHEVSLMSSLADDEPAQWALQQLNSLGITTSRCRVHRQCATPISSIWRNRANGSRTIVHYRDLPELKLSDLRAIDAENFAWIHFEGRNIATLAQYLPSLARADVALSLEIEKSREGIEALSRYVQLVILSSHYLNQLNISAAEGIKKIRAINPRALVVCTLGAQGLVAIDQSGKAIELDAVAVPRVIDSIGAGDCFIAALISAKLHGQSFRSALEYARSIVAQKIQLNGMTINNHE